MDLDPSVVWDFAGTLVGTFRERPRQLPATVSRVDPDGTVWLSMPGADGLVPASTTADVSADDAVTVEWWGNAYHVTGNGTSPSVGTRAAAALRRATAAAAKVAGEAKGIADAVGQHFWSDDNGVHVSNEDGNATGERNILMNSLGILLRQGSAWLASFSDSAVAFYDGLGNEAANIVAQFGADGARIGKLGAAHSVIDSDGQRFYADDGSTQLANIGYGEVATQSGTAVAPYYTFGRRAANSAVGSMSVAEGLDTTASQSYSHAEGLGTTASGTLAHAEGADTTSSGMSSHSEGTETVASGNYSHAEGYGSASSGAFSHAEGLLTEASGDMAHAQNYGTVAGHDNQTAIGKYNDNDPDNAFEVGNGTADDARSNAFAVGWDGTLYTARDTDTTTVADVLTAAQGVTIGAVSYVQRGGVAALFVRASRSAATSGATTIGTLVTGKRPVMETAAPAPSGSGDVYAAADGTVTYRPSGTVAAGSNLYVRITYLVA